MTATGHAKVGNRGSYEEEQPGEIGNKRMCIELLVLVAAAAAAASPASIGSSRPGCRCLLYMLSPKYPQRAGRFHPPAPTRHDTTTHLGGG